MYNLSSTSKRRIVGIKPVLIDILLEGIKDSPFDFGIPLYGGLRTKERQEYLYSIGRTTELDRSPITWTTNSYHMTGKAFDIFAYVDGKATWEHKYYEPIARHLQKIAKDLFCIELEWGGDWNKKDLPHFQFK